jgi:hypothetical protein
MLSAAELVQFVEDNFAEPRPDLLAALDTYCPLGLNRELAAEIPRVAKKQNLPQDEEFPDDRRKKRPAREIKRSENPLDDLSPEGQVVVRLMAELVFQHVSDASWLTANANELHEVWALHDRHPCLGIAGLAKFKNVLIAQRKSKKDNDKNQGGGGGGGSGEGGIHTTVVACCGSCGCPQW